jgi:hypothetical protein
LGILNKIEETSQVSDMDNFLMNNAKPFHESKQHIKLLEAAL